MWITPRAVQQMMKGALWTVLEVKGSLQLLKQKTKQRFLPFFCMARKTNHITFQQEAISFRKMVKK